MNVNYEPYSVVVDPADTVYEDWRLARVTELTDGAGWEVHGQGGMVCLVPRLRERAMGADERETVPKVGDRLRLYGRFGTPIEGQVLNGTVLWYRDREQRAEYRRRQLADIEAAKQRRFAIEQVALDMRYARLPEPFQRRIDRLRAENSDFRVDAESYESFCLEQAAVIADHFETEEAIKAWASLNTAEHDYDYAEEQRQAPPGYSDGHSGNTHGAAVFFACALLRGEDV